MMELFHVHHRMHELITDLARQNGYTEIPKWQLELLGSTVDRDLDDDGRIRRDWSCSRHVD